MLRSRSLCCILCSLIGLFLAWLLLARAPDAAYSQGKAGPVSFINDVAPILKETCFACHDAKKRKGKFRKPPMPKFPKGGKKGRPGAPRKSKGRLDYRDLKKRGPRPDAPRRSR